jgi:hypothetical protein
MLEIDFSFQHLVFWNLVESSIAKTNIWHILNPHLTK